MTGLPSAGEVTGLGVDNLDVWVKFLAEALGTTHRGAGARSAR